MMTETSDIPEGYKVTELGVLPKEWEIHKLGELFSIQQGASMSQNRRDGSCPHPFLRTVNVLWGRIDVSVLDKMNFSLAEIEKLSLINDDLLICEGGDIGRTALWNSEIEKCCYQNHLHRLRKKTDTVDPSFVMYWMQAAILHLGYYSSEGNRTTIPNLSKSRLSNFQIPLPPLPEQHSIANVLRTVQEAKEKTEAIIEAAKLLKASMMKHLLMYGPVPVNETEKVILKETEIGMVPVGWDVTTFKSILSEKLRNGLSKRETTSADGVRTLILTAVTKNDISLKYTKITEAKPEDVDDLWIRSGDIFIERANTPEYVGLASVYLGIEPFAIFPDLLIRARVKRDLAEPKFIAEYLLSPRIRNYFSMCARRTTGNMPKIGHDTVESILISLPPIDTQRRVVEIIDIIDDKIFTEVQRKSALDQLFKTLLHDLMTAKVRVQHQGI